MRNRTCQHVTMLKLTWTIDPVNIDELWDIFKNGLLTSINNNIPQKTITSKMKLPWVNNKLRKQINRNKRLHRKCKTNTSLRDKYKNNRRTLQSDMRKAYWTYIENMIFDLPVNDSDTQCFKRTPKKLFSYIKSMKNENTGISALRNNGILTNIYNRVGCYITYPRQRPFTISNNE